ncbi:DUF2892 domain-containing protein [Halostella sp. PRR32]|uniref:YgaP family membrane protein n=1 Tax=Halostella sp. PRR32 TaxID=3098147 RepID=UPI002B1E03A9|nr:DUF2892 domain-containing protein [Halostella sp. PRR32]
MAKNVGDTERIARLIAGTALVLLALTANRSRATRVLTLLGGSELLYTATTQYCPANAALGRDTYPSDQDRDLMEMPA